MALNGPFPPGIHALVHPPPLDPVTPLAQPKWMHWVGPTDVWPVHADFCIWFNVTVEHAPQMKRLTRHVCLPPFSATWSMPHEPGFRRLRGTWEISETKTSPEEVGYVYHWAWEDILSTYTWTCWEHRKKAQSCYLFFPLMLLLWISQPLVLKNNLEFFFPPALPYPPVKRREGRWVGWMSIKKWSKNSWIHFVQQLTLFWWEWNVYTRTSYNVQLCNFSDSVHKSHVLLFAFKPSFV